MLACLACSACAGHSRRKVASARQAFAIQGDERPLPALTRLLLLALKPTQGWYCPPTLGLLGRKLLDSPRQSAVVLLKTNIQDSLRNAIVGPESMKLNNDPWEKAGIRNYTGKNHAAYAALIRKKPSRRLGIHGLNETTTARDLEAHFTSFGHQVEDARVHYESPWVEETDTFRNGTQVGVMRKSSIKVSKCNGWVDFKTEEAAFAAAEQVDGSLLDYCQLAIKPIPKRELIRDREETYDESDGYGSHPVYTRLEEDDGSIDYVLVKLLLDERSQYRKDKNGEKADAIYARLREMGVTNVNDIELTWTTGALPDWSMA